MSLFDKIIGEEQLRSLPSDQQEQARSIARREFWLNTILGGRGLASGFEAARGVVPAMQAQQRQRQIGQAIEQSMVPTGTGLTQFGPGTQGGMLLGELQGFENDPAAAAMIDQAAMRNPNIPRVFDAAAFTRNVAPLVASGAPGAQAKTALEIAQMGAPVSAEGGLLLDPFTRQVRSSVPTISGNIQRQFNVNTGQFEAQPVTGALSAQARTTLPTLGTNQEFVFDRSGQPIGVRNMDGSIQALTERVSAETTASEGAKAEFDFVDVTMPDGSVQKVTRAEAARMRRGVPGQTQGPQPVVAQLSDAQRAVNEQFRTNLKNAELGFETARRRAGTIQQLRNAINNPDFETGAFANQKAALTNMLASIGVTGERANSFLRSATSFRQGVNDLTMGSLAELVGAISNFEIDFSKNRFGTMTDPREANQFALDLLEAKDRRNIAYYNYLNKNPSADAVSNWLTSEEGSKNLFEDPKLLKWLPQRVIPSGPDKGKTAYLLPDSEQGTWVVKD